MPQATPLLTIFNILFGLASLTLNMHAKLEICSFDRSRDIRWVPAFKNTARDIGKAPLQPNFVSTYWCQLAHQIST